MQVLQSIHSDILNEDRPYWVHLPASYENEPDRHYPVVVILDGEMNGLWVPGILDFMARRKRMSEVVAVGIHSSDPEVGLPQDTRVRDTTPTHSIIEYNGEVRDSYEPSGGADNFLRFVGEELLPHIDAEYRTEPERAIVGHSLTGTLVTHAFVTGNPHFEAYVPIDACFWWDDQVSTRMLGDLPSDSNVFKNSFFIACGGRVPVAVKAQTATRSAEHSRRGHGVGRRS